MAATAGLSAGQGAMATGEDQALLAQLARFACGTRLEAVPEAVRRQARLSLLDTIGCIASGAQLPEAQQVLAAESARGGSQEASVPGRRDRFTVEAATRVNGYMGEVFALGELVGGHATLAIAVPALALAESLGSSGAQLLEAVIAGTETVCRLDGSNDAQAGAAGAAAAAAKLMNFNETRTLQSIAMARALTSWGAAELVFGQGHLLKPILAGGWPGAIGLMATNYARHGLGGATCLQERAVEEDAGVRPESEHWRLARPLRKLHACSGYMHAAIEAVTRLRQQGALAGEWRLRVHVPGLVLRAVSRQGRPPATPDEARVNLEYCLALAAVEADVILPRHSMRCAAEACRPDVIAALARIEVLAEPAFEHGSRSRVEVLDAGGRTVLELSTDAPRGTERNPMSDDEVEAKFVRLAEGFLDREHAQAYVARLHGLETSPRTGWLLRSFL